MVFFVSRVHRCAAGLLASFLICSITLQSAAVETFSDALTRYHDWKHSGSMWLLTTPEGANLLQTDPIKDFPLLLRLALCSLLVLVLVKLVFTTYIQRQKLLMLN